MRALPFPLVDASTRRPLGEAAVRAAGGAGAELIVGRTGAVAVRGVRSLPVGCAPR